MFTGILRGHCNEDAGVAIARSNLMIDIRWPEVSRALADAVCRQCGCLRNPDAQPLARDIGLLMGSASTIAFGTTCHSEIPSWFLQNNECLLAATLHKMLVEFVTSCEVIVRYNRYMMKRAFCLLLEIAEGMRSYLGLPYLSESTGAHALMSAVTNSKYDFLSKDAMILHPSERIFADVLAEQILADPNRAMEPSSAFCFFARSKRMREFTSVCLNCDGLGGALAQLLAEVDLATRRLADSRSLQAVLSPNRPARRTRARTPMKLSCAAIAKPTRRTISPRCDQSV